MPVVIEELQADVAPQPTTTSSSSSATPGAPAAALDERELMELLARAQWRCERLFAD